MKSQKFTCLLFLVAFLALSGASGWFVYRREPNAAFMGGLIGGVILIVAFSWGIAIPDRIADWLRIVRARFGGEPGDGKRVAIVGTLRGHGELQAPFSRMRCVAYEYELIAVPATRKAYEGFAMVPLSIEHSAGARTRILARPELKVDKNHPDPRSAEANARLYIENTEWDAPRSAETVDRAHGDGRIREDIRHDPPAEAANAHLVERIIPPDVDVCAMGTYSEDKHALVGDVTLEVGQSFGIRAAWRVVNAAFASAFCLALATVAAVLFCANFPLDAAEAANPQWTLTWPEIQFERVIDQRVRRPLTEAGILSMSGFSLREVCDGCAVGKLEIDGRTIELRHAAYVGGRAVHISATPGAKDGVTLDNKKLVVTIDGKSAPVPASWLQPNDIVTALGSGPEVADYAGRITIVAPDGWIRCRVSFRTKVQSGAWL